MQFRTFFAITLASLLVSCGGGSDDSAIDAAAITQDERVFRAAPKAAMEAVTAAQTQILLGSDPGEFVGAGRSYAYTQASAVIQVDVTEGVLHLRIHGDESWDAHFALPTSRRRFNGGTFSNLGRYPSGNPEVGSMSWSGEGRGCNTLLGSFRVNSSEYVGGELVAVDMDFVQQCDAQPPALFGNIRWFANDPTQPRGPVRNVPARLWSPAPDAMPASGSFVYLESEATDYIGDGRRYTYTPRNAHLTVKETEGRLTVFVNGDEMWSADFQAMNVLPRMRAGWYPKLQRYPMHNPTAGGLSWSGDGRGCNNLSGWFVVDEITYVAGELATVDMRFEQHCLDVFGWTGALNGRIRWDINDTTTPPGPRPAPERLWAPAAGATPAVGNYLYLHSVPGDYIGQGLDYLYTTGVSVSSDGTKVKVYSNGWSGTFAAMDSIPRLRRGYYPGLHRHPFHNPALGGMTWSGQGRGCNELDGWFVVDHISHDSLGALMAVDLRFSQTCTDVGNSRPIRGEVHWVRSP
ncbi:hypothetical protein WG902_22305 [Ramlibacter sp. PS3R-8]|uniref:hypothetical protein n=1 Tax=Ramlibacter sp. PS3R-8 TaxID=3133437 RepID=UPI0030A4E95A